MKSDEAQGNLLFLMTTPPSRGRNSAHPRAPARRHRTLLRTTIGAHWRHLGAPPATMILQGNPLLCHLVFGDISGELSGLDPAYSPTCEIELGRKFA